MKIRTDFVTNSSSSSYILKDDNMEEIQKAFEARKGEILSEEWYNEEAYEQFLYWMKSIKPTPIREHELSAIFEVAGWYRNYIYKNIFEGKLGEGITIDWEDFWKWEKLLLKRLEEIGLTDEMLEQLVMVLMLECIDEKNYCTGKNWKDRYGDDKVSEETIADYLLDVVSQEVYLGDEILLFAVWGYYDKVLACALKWAYKPAGEILEELLGAKYMYFDSMETHYLIGETIEASPNCILGCNHMG